MNSGKFFADGTEIEGSTRGPRGPKNNHYGDTDNYDGEKVRKEEGSYAFFMEAASIEYNMQQYCDLRSALVLLQFRDSFW